MIRVLGNRLFRGIIVGTSILLAIELVILFLLADIRAITLALVVAAVVLSFIGFGYVLVFLFDRYVRHERF